VYDADNMSIKILDDKTISRIAAGEVIERGERNPTLKNITAIARALSMSL